MAGRQSRSTSIPIPRSVSSTSPTRNIESVIPLPFSFSPSRPRIASAQGIPQRSSTVDDHRASLGVRGSSSFVGSPPSRGPARSLTHSSVMPTRGSPRSPSTFEPRVIRADSSRTIDPACLPSTSTSPTRTRRPSVAGTRAPSAQRSSTAPIVPPAPLPPAPFPRPAYLDHSALRHLLHTEAPPPLLPGRKTDLVSAEPQAFPARARPISPPTDSDDESSVSPPRELTLPAPVVLLPAEGALRLPTRWSDQVRHPSLSVSSDGRDLTYHAANSSGERDAAAARTVHPVPPACGIYYYEVNIVSKGQKGHISIGFAARDVRLSRLPGWEKNSWGYHGDDGVAFYGERNGTPYGPTYGTGDVVGCGIDFSQNKLFYTKNGTFLGMVFEKVGKDCEIYPSIGLRHSEESVRVNFGHEPFKYDIEDHVLQQRNATWSSILSTPLDIFPAPPATSASSAEASEEQAKVRLDALVLSYLTHHGYARTARAFQAQCERRAAPLPVPPPPPAAAHDVDMDIGDDPVTLTGDIEARTRIVRAVAGGDVEFALGELQTRYPAVLEREEGLMLFKLRCRRFVELILEAAELKKRMFREEADGEAGAAAMDVDDDEEAPALNTSTNGFGSTAVPIKGPRRGSLSTPASTPGAADYESALHTAITYGQTLQTDYRGDTRPEVQTVFKRTFGVVAYDDPLSAGGEVAEVAGPEARVALANQVNQAILQSQGRPMHPTLERIYRQAAACVLQLGLMGVGQAAFADMKAEFLDA